MTRVDYILLDMNPGCDRWLVIGKPSAFQRVFRADSVKIVASGKGINVARCFARMGFHRYTGLYIAGGDMGRMLTKMVIREGLDMRAIGIQDETRVNMTALLTYQQETITFNEPGPHILEDEIHAFFSVYRKMLDDHPGADVVISGSAAADFSVSHYLRLLAYARETDHRLMIDIGGAWLKKSVGDALDTLKINREEFKHAFGIDAMLEQEKMKRFINRHPIRTIIVTDGANGSVAYSSAGESWTGEFNASAAGGYAVGSGDSFMAGYLAAKAAGAGICEALKEATAYGMANARVFEPAMIDPKLVREAYPYIIVKRL